MPSPYKLKRLKVRISRSMLREREVGDIRDQLLFRRCAVRLKRFNPDQGKQAGVDDEKSRAYKLRRLCVRLPRLWTQLANTPYASAASDISSRSSSVKDAENETIDMEDVESVG
ncbi:uncharacterized protein LOC119642202 isoform X3 [Glossina fuscipes]|uniref:Uncharacterized protein LOC119642202 isoform X3 n=1 Tax=Glossina fuscipes TaxID=7396 RepID=A0A9C5ZCQ5_9MUSC|nr:uncharacterized protein LOC119642202 isoform X3 [Glossina fuscipes]